MYTQLESLKAILNNGSLSFDGRNGATISLYGTQHRYPAELGAPIPTTKAVKDKWVSTELEWFLKGLTDNKWLVERGVPIWNKWDRQLLDHDGLLAWLDLYPDPQSPHTTLKTKGLNLTEYRNVPESERVDVLRKLALEHDISITTGELGPVYGVMFRAWPTRDGATIDQIQQLDENLRKVPMSRRHVVSLWNPELLPDEKADHATNIDNGLQVLPPCHLLQHVMIEELSVIDICKANALSEAEFIDLLKDIIPTDLGSAVRSKLPAGNVYLEAKFLHRFLPSTPISNLIQIVKSDDEYSIDSLIDRAVLLPMRLLELLTDLDYDLRTSILGYLKAAGYKTHKVHLQFYMRSNDEPVGRPFNVFSYYLLKEIIANVHNFVSGDLIQSTGVAHIYLDQVDAVMEQLSRTPDELPTLRWKRRLSSITDFTVDDYELIGYNPQSFIKTPVSS